MHRHAKLPDIDDCASIGINGSIALASSKRSAFELPGLLHAELRGGRKSNVSALSEIGYFPMPRPTSLEAGMRPAADLPGVVFARCCGHAKHECSFDSRSTSL